MTRQLTFILTILTFAACQNNKRENPISQLESYIIKTDSLTSNSETFDQIVNDLLTNKLDFKPDQLELTKDDSTGFLKEQVFRLYYDTTGKYEDLNCSIKLKEFSSDRKAAEDFCRVIEFQACCIPDEDIIKLKNFENLDYFKNSASTTLLTENIVIEIRLGNKTKDNKEISKLLDEFLKERKYLKLEIGHGGPAVWTRKYGSTLDD